MTDSDKEFMRLLQILLVDDGLRRGFDVPDSFDHKRKVWCVNHARELIHRVEEVEHDKRQREVDAVKAEIGIDNYNKISEEFLEVLNAPSALMQLLPPVPVSRQTIDR